MVTYDYLAFRDARRQIGLKMADVADILKVSPATIGNWENGIVKGNMDGIIKLMRFYRLSPDDVFKHKLERKIQDE